MLVKLKQTKSTVLIFILAVLVEKLDETFNNKVRFVIKVCLMQLKSILVTNTKLVQTLLFDNFAFRVWRTIAIY